jgi:hypothetical protein
VGRGVCELDEDGVSETLGGRVGVSEDQVEGLLVGLLADELLGLEVKVPLKGGVWVGDMVTVRESRVGWGVPLLAPVAAPVRDTPGDCVGANPVGVGLGVWEGVRVAVGQVDWVGLREDLVDREGAAEALPWEDGLDDTEGQKDTSPLDVEAGEVVGWDDPVE